MVALCKAAQLSKTELLIEVTDAGMVTDTSDESLQKALLPMVVTDP